MILRLSRVLLILLICSIRVNAENGEAYKLLLGEIEILTHYNSLSSENQTLIDSAKSAARRSDFDMATIFLEVVIDNLYDKTSTLIEQPDKQPPEAFDRTEFKIVSGIDFNRQEFEVGYIETDSVILDEVNKPFIGLNLDYIFNGNREQGLGSYIYFRLDNENIEARFKLLNPYKISQIAGNNTLEFNYDHNDLNKEISYWELASRQSFNYSGTKWYFQLDNYLRFKNYHQPSQSVPNFLKNTMNASAIYQSSLIRNIRLSYQADFNESLNYRNNDFFEHYAELGFSNWLPGPVANEFIYGFSYNNFTYALDDSVISNLSKTVTGRLNTRIPLVYNFYLKSDNAYKYKFYRVKSEQDPDYEKLEINASIEKLLFSNLSAGLGYHFQERNHKLSKDSNPVYIEEQDYNEKGISAELNYHNLNKIYFTGMITYSKRKYLHSTDSDIISFYKSKNILNIFVLFQTPVWDNLVLNVFLSYDGDRELDNDKNDTRSIIFSSELEYAF